MKENPQKLRHSLNLSFPGRMNLQQYIIIYHSIKVAELLRKNISSNWPACPLVTCCRLGRYSDYKCSPSNSNSSTCKFAWIFPKWRKSWRILRNNITWKHVECIKWPHGRAFTGELDVKMYSWHIGQLSSKHFSLHICALRERDMQALQFMQWK